MSIKERLKTLSIAEIIVLVTIASLLLFVIKFFGLKKEYKTIRVEVIRKNWSENSNPYGYRAPYWISDKIKIGQTEKDKAGRVIATLINLENYERGGEEAELYLTLEVQTVLNKKTSVYTFKDKPLNLGASIELSLNNIDLQGQIVDNDYPENGYPSKEFLVKVKGYSYNPDIVSKIKPGLKMYNRATGESIAEIISVYKEDSAYQNVNYDSNRKFLKIKEGQDQDITIEIKLKSYKMDNKWYFSGHQNLKVLENMYLYTDEINLYTLEIQSIKEIN